MVELALLRVEVCCTSVNLPLLWGELHFMGNHEIGLPNKLFFANNYRFFYWRLTGDLTSFEGKISSLIKLWSWVCFVVSLFISVST